MAHISCHLLPFAIIAVLVRTAVQGSSTANNSRRPNFLGLFTNCTVSIRSTLKTTDGDRVWNEKSRYLKYFGENTPITVDDKFSSNEDSCQSPSEIEYLNKTSEAIVGCHRIQSQVLATRLACSAQVYFLENIVGEKGDFLSLHKILEDVVLRDENPHYIIFIRSYSHEESVDFRKSEEGFYSNLYRLTLTSKFLVVDSKRKKVKMVCMHCRGSLENQLRNIPMSAIHSLADLDNIWLNLHGNLMGRSIEALNYRTEEIIKYESQGCGLYKAGLKTDPNICAILAMSVSLNMTPFATDYKIYGHVKSGMMSYADYNEQMFLTPSSSKYEWSTAAEYFEPFVYITVVDKNALNISALWRTFDPSTWAALISTFIGLAALFAATTSSRYEIMRNRLINLRFTFVLFTAILLEQSQLTIWKVKMRLNMVSKVIIITWIFAAVVISSLYRGTIYSYLATSIPPPIPPTTKDLVESPYFLVTTTSYHYQGKPCSTLVGILNEMTIGQPGVDFPVFYKDLKEHVHFIPVSHAEIVKAHTQSSPLLAIDTHSYNDHSKSKRSLQHNDRSRSQRSLQQITGHQVKQQKYDNLYIFQNVSIPENFAIIGSQFDVETLKKLMETFATAFVQKSSTVHTFLNRTPWIIRRNFFLPLFQPALAHLYESGLYCRWRELSEIHHVTGEFQAVHELLQKDEPVRNYLALLFSGMTILENHTLKPKPLSWEIFDSAFVFYILCSTGSILVFLTEWFFFIFAKFILNVERNVVRSQQI